MTAVDLGSLAGTHRWLLCSIRVLLRFGRSARLAISAFAQLHAWFETSHVPRAQRHRRPDSGIASDPSAAETQREAAEAPNLEHPRPERYSTVWSSIIFTEVSTSRPTNWCCFRVMRWTGSDFVIGPLWRVRWGRERWRRRGRGARTPRADPSHILIDGVNDERIQPNGSFPDHAGRTLVPCFAIRGHEPPLQSTTGATALECGSARSRRARPPRADGRRAGWCRWTRAPQCTPRPRGSCHFADTRSSRCLGSCARRSRERLSA